MVKHVAVEQGSVEWLKARMGKPTASQFHRIITPAKGELSKSHRHFMFRLLAERLLNEIGDSIEGQEWLERGKELEQQAVKHLEFEREILTEPCGFLLTDDSRIGASPDRLLVREAAAIEVKCPAPWTHLEWMFDGFGSYYYPQVQGQIFVGEFEWVARYAYHPSMPSVFKPTYRDDQYQTKLRAALTQFCDELDELEERARKRGVFAERLRTMTPIEAAYDEAALKSRISAFKYDSLQPAGQLDPMMPVILGPPTHVSDIIHQTESMGYFFRNRYGLGVRYEDIDDAIDAALHELDSGAVEGRLDAAWDGVQPLIADLREQGYGEMDGKIISHHGALALEISKRGEDEPPGPPPEVEAALISELDRIGGDAACAVAAPAGARPAEAEADDLAVSSLGDTAPPPLTAPDVTFINPIATGGYLQPDGTLGYHPDDKIEVLGSKGSGATVDIAEQRTGPPSPRTKTVEEAYEQICRAGDIGLSDGQCEIMGITPQMVEYLVKQMRVDFNSDGRLYIPGIVQPSIREPVELPLTVDLAPPKPDVVDLADAEMRKKAASGPEALRLYWLKTSRTLTPRVRKEIRNRMPAYEAIARESR